MPKKKSTVLRIDDDGKIEPRSRADWFINVWLADNLEMYAGKRAKLTIQPLTRTLAQNSYWFGVVIETIRKGLLDAGYEFSAEDIHEHFARKYLPMEVTEWTDLDTGEVKEKRERKSTTDCTTTEFHNLIERVRHDEIVRELGVYIPDPNEEEEMLHSKYSDL